MKVRMYLLRTVVPMMVVLTSLLVPLAAWGLAQGYPDIFMQISPATNDIPVGGSATIIVSIVSQEGFEGQVQLTAQSVPDGVTVTFDPNTVDVPAYGQGDVNMTVSTASGVSAGSVALTIVGTSKEQFDLREGHNNIKESIPFTIMITSPTTTKTTTTNTTTTTSTSTSQTLTTSTPTISTKTSAEAGQVADYTLPIMTAVAVIALVVVATVALRRRK